MSAIKRKLSVFGFLLNSIAGRMAPNTFPKWGTFVLCMPVSTRVIIGNKSTKIKRIRSTRKGLVKNPSLLKNFFSARPLTTLKKLL